MLRTVCIKCNRKLNQGEKCKCSYARHKEYDRFNRNTEAKEFYHSKEWIKLTAMSKNKCNGLDLFELYENNKIIKGELSHHIIPVEDDSTKKLDVNNLIYVSQRTHNYIHKVYSSSLEEKRKLQKKLFNYLEKLKKINEGE